MIVALVAIGLLAVATGLLVGLSNSGGSGDRVDSDAAEGSDGDGDGGAAEVDEVAAEPDPIADEPVEPPEVVPAEGSGPADPDPVVSDGDHGIPDEFTTFEPESPRRGWFLILSSALKTDRDEWSMLEARDDLARFDPSVGLYDSNRVCFAADDVWIVGIPGFGSSEAALDRCGVFGLEEGTECFAINVENGTRSHGPAQPAGTC